MQAQYFAKNAKNDIKNKLKTLMYPCVIKSEHLEYHIYFRNNFSDILLHILELMFPRDTSIKHIFNLQNVMFVIENRPRTLYN